MNLKLEQRCIAFSENLAAGVSARKTGARCLVSEASEQLKKETGCLGYINSGIIPPSYIGMISH